MALDPVAKADLADAIKTAFDTGFSETDPAKRDEAMQAVADGIADACDAFVKKAIATVTIPTNTVVTTPGSPATTGLLNPAPIPLLGDPNGGTGGLS